MTALPRGVESAVIYENFAPRNVVPQAKFTQKTENSPPRRGRTRVDSPPLALPAAIVSPEDAPNNQR